MAAKRSKPGAAREAPGRSERREEIRTKARDLFLRHGYRKTTIEDIGKACGLGKAALYYYFPDKEAILTEVVTAENASMLGHMRKAAAGAGSPRGRLVAMVKARFIYAHKHLSAMPVLDELDELLPMVAGMRQGFFEEEAQLVRDILADGVRVGAFKPQRLDLLPHVFISAIRGLESHLGKFKDRASLEEGLDALLKLLCEGLCR